MVFSPVLKKIYSTVCYQNDLKTYTIFGKKLLVCIRCTGIYSGALFFSFILLFIKKIKVGEGLFLASLSAMISDVILCSTGLFYYSKYFAFMTGFFFGSIAFLYIFIILENEFFEKDQLDVIK
jgi:uncharacterized membrane protein